MKYRTLFILSLLFFSPSYSQNIDPCNQAQQDAKNAVWRPGWWAGGFLGNYFIPYGTIAVAFFYAPQPASVPDLDSLDQRMYNNCFERAVKKTQLQYQTIGFLGLMITYATLNYAISMIWEMPDQGEAPFTLPKERSFFYYLGGLALSLELIKTLNSEENEPHSQEKIQALNTEMCNIHGKIKLCSMERTTG